MGRVYDDISEEQARWIGEQPMFFAATAAPDAHVNVSLQGWVQNTRRDRRGAQSGYEAAIRCLPPGRTGQAPGLGRSGSQA
jgi:hypothetical protein